MVQGLLYMAACGRADVFKFLFGYIVDVMFDMPVRYIPKWRLGYAVEYTYWKLREEGLPGDVQTKAISI